MTSDPIEAARLDTIKAICRREKHNWAEITDFKDLPLTQFICVRGCGARRYGIHRGASLTPGQLARLMPADGSVTVTDIEIIVEPDQP